MRDTSILARMFASFAKDEDTTPEEIAAAADEIQSITVTTDPNNAAQGVSSASVHDGEIGEPDKADEIIDLLKQLLASKTADAAPAPTPAPEMPMDPNADVPPMTDEDIAPLNNLEKELGGDADPVGPAEAESQFVDPEDINETDEDIDPAMLEDPTLADEDPIDPALAGEEPVMEDENMPLDPAAMGKPVPSQDRAIRLAIDAIKPFIATLPKNQRRKAADAAVRQIRTRMGRDAKASANGYAKIAQAKRRKASDAAAQKLAGRALGRKITSERNVNYKK